MKVLVIHNYHRKGSASGDDLVFKNEVKLLRKYGNTVITYTTINDDFDKKNIFGKIFQVFGMFWSFKHYANIRKIIKKESPKIVHIHTFFPLLSPSVLVAAKKGGCKVVATLHDTRFICPCATSLKNGKICNECSDGKYFRMYKNKCFKNSKIQSLIVASIFKFHRIMKTFYRYIDKYICLNDSQIKLLENIGFDKNKIVKKYNFVTDNNFEFEENNTEYKLPLKYVVYYGRLGEEKGIFELIKIWNRIPDIPLVIMGGGPLESDVKAWSEKRKNIYYLGYVEHEDCLKIVKSAEFVVFPSIWYEGCSMVEIEAESLGKPIIATKLGFSSEAIINEKNGFTVELGDLESFKEKIYRLWNNPELCKLMGKNARLEYEEKYVEDKNYDILEKIYKEL